MHLEVLSDDPLILNQLKGKCLHLFIILKNYVTYHNVVRVFRDSASEYEHFFTNLKNFINLQLICEYFVKAHILTQSHEKDIQRSKFF